ncbi:MAG TPA: hypothetical protein VF817_01735 [Patescibacteria group bacterium]
MDIISHFEKVVMQELAEKIKLPAHMQNFVGAKLGLIMGKSHTKLSPEIKKLGGSLEKSGNGASENYCLIFTGNPFTFPIIHESKSVGFFLYNAASGQHIIKRTTEQISVLKIKDLPEAITKRLKQLAAENISCAVESKYRIKTSRHTDSKGDFP